MTDAQGGQILFGGVDTAKFQGKLTTIPIDKQTGATKAAAFVITLTSVSLTNHDGKQATLTADDFAIPILLDTGTTYTYLPTNLWKGLCDQVGAQFSDRTGAPTVPCDVRNNNGTVNYSFSGATISVSMNGLVMDAFAYDGSPARYKDGTLQCYFGILDAGSDNNVLVSFPMRISTHRACELTSAYRATPSSDQPTSSSTSTTKRSALGRPSST